MDHLIAGERDPTVLAQLARARRRIAELEDHRAGGDRCDHRALGVPAGRRCAADFIALLQMLAEAFPRAPVIVVICDNDSIHHARAVTAYLKEQPRLELLYGARYSPQDNPVERIWAALKNYVANADFRCAQQDGR
jgi:hypothetical protein